MEKKKRRKEKREIVGRQKDRCCYRYIDVTFLRRPRSLFLYDTLFPGNSVTNVCPFHGEIAFDSVAPGGYSCKKLNSL